MSNFPVVYTPEPTRPSGGAMPGAKALLSFVVDTFDAALYGDEIKDLGIYNPRDVYGNQWPDWRTVKGRKRGSQHARGAAGDAGVPVRRPKGHPEGHRLADWLVKHHADLGVQEVIWAGRRWDNQSQQWRRYSGRSDHFDHVHFALNDPAARRLTMPMILAIWADHPAPADPTTGPRAPEAEDDDMVIYTPHAGAGIDGGKSFAVQGNERRHLGPDAYKGLRAAGTPERSVDAHGWQVVLDMTELVPAGRGKPGTTAGG